MIGCLNTWLTKIFTPNRRFLGVQVSKRIDENDPLMAMITFSRLPNGTNSGLSTKSVSIQIFTTLKFLLRS